MEFLQEQISLHGARARPPNGDLKYDLDNRVEILIKKMDPYELDWYELSVIASGLWDYIVTGRRYRTVTFDVLDIENDAQIGWGHIVTLGRDSLLNKTSKRGLQDSSLALLSENSIPNQHNSSLTPLVGSVRWPIKDSDLILQFATINTDKGGRQFLEPEAVKDLFLAVIEIVQHNIEIKGEGTPLGFRSFRHGRSVMFEIINWPRMLNWEQFGDVVLGVIDFIIDHVHYRTYTFSVFIKKNEIAIGKICHGLLEDNNVTIARRDSVSGGRVP